MPGRLRVGEGEVTTSKLSFRRYPELSSRPSAAHARRRRRHGRQSHGEQAPAPQSRLHGDRIRRAPARSTARSRAPARSRRAPRRATARGPRARSDRTHAADRSPRCRCPVSRTVIAISSLDRRVTATSTRPPDGVYLIAFVTRLSSSCRSRVRSPITTAFSSVGSDSVSPASSPRITAVSYTSRTSGSSSTGTRIEVEPPFVGARERQQTVDEIRHARGLLQRLLERHHLVGPIRRRMHGALDVGAQHGERRLELVARIGREAPQRGERRLEARQHRVHRQAQPGELIVARRIRRQTPVQDCVRR